MKAIQIKLTYILDSNLINKVYIWNKNGHQYYFLLAV